MTGYYGKYRGKVENNVDQRRLGRIQVSCPSVLGDGQVSWAMPSAPYAGPGVGFLAIPPVGANVWVEFEAGDTERPIWGGCFWERDELPSDMGKQEKKVFKTATATLTLSDLSGDDGGVTIETKDGRKIAMKAQSIEITDGKWSIKLTSASVSINGGALEVT